MEGTASRKSNAAPAAFLEKLYDILEEVSLESYISWQPDGLSFLIRDVNSVSELVLPHYFKHNNIQSFVRQLNMYSFTKTRHDSNYREFRQPLFQRGRRDLLSLIKRKTQGSSDKNALIKRKLGALESEVEYKCVTTTTDEESEDKLSSDGGEDDVCEEASSSSTCSSESEIYTGPINSRSKELEELRSCMNNVESQMWCLNEKYSALSASYSTLKEKFEKYQNYQVKSPKLSSLNQLPVNPIWNIPSNPLPTVEAGTGIVRMISFDSQRQSDIRSVPGSGSGSGPRVQKIFPSMTVALQKESSVSSYSNHAHLIGLVSGADGVFQERSRRKLNPLSALEYGPGPRPLTTGTAPQGEQGQGLDAMAAAATLLSGKPLLHDLPAPPRSSLADLLDAANFNGLETTSLVQLKSR